MAIQTDLVRAPFSWFGGKATVAHIVWDVLGDVDNYVEPFFGSGSVLLNRPHAPRVETINDADHMVANFWRAVQADPDAVAHHADWPVNETDLHARHYWLITEGRRRLEKINGDPTAYDAQVAGWWCWGLCAWIGRGFMYGNGPWQWTGDAWEKSDTADGQGINRQLPHLSGGQGINRQLPHLSGGRGINRTIDRVRGSNRSAFIREWMAGLSERLRDVRVCCGDWSRVTSDAVTFRNGLTGVFLDPPYADTAGRTANLYSVDCLSVAHDVRAWAIEAGNHPLMRIVLAGYDGEHAMPDDWHVIQWKARGGYGNQADGRGRDNAYKERLWLSPACVRPDKPQRSLFDLMEAAE